MIIHCSILEGWPSGLRRLIMGQDNALLGVRVHVLSFEFFSNFHQTFRVNSSFSKVFESKRAFSPKEQYHKEHFKLGPMYVLKCALSEK